MSKNSLSFLTCYFLIIPAITLLPPPSADFSSSGRTPPTLPISPPALLLFAFQMAYILRRRVIYTGRRATRRSIYYLLFSHNSCDHFASASFRRFQFKWPNAPDAPDRSPSTNIVCISASLQLKDEGDIHREERGGMMMGFYIGRRGG